MVTKALTSISSAEKKLEQAISASIDDNHTQDLAEQAAKEMRKLAETATFTAISATSQWGKKALDKTKEITEEISL